MLALTQGGQSMLALVMHVHASSSCVAFEGASLAIALKVALKALWQLTDKAKCVSQCRSKGIGGDL